MLKNYIKIACRNLMKNKIFSFINIIGLSFSVAFCLLLFFYIRHEQSYDSFHAKKDRLFRLEMTTVRKRDDVQPKKSIFSFLTKNDDVENNVIFPLIVGPDMQSAFPEIESITRFKDVGHHFGAQLIKADHEVYKEKDLLYADDNFFTNFSFRLIKGNPNTVLSSPENVVLTESTAKKYFGNKDPIGKTIELVTDNNRLLTVAGIVEDVPVNSSIEYSMIMPLRADPRYKQNIDERFNHAEHVFIVELEKGISAAQFLKKAGPWVTSYFAEYFKDFSFLYSTDSHLYLRPLENCHYNTAYEWGHYTDAKSIYEVSCLVFVILLIASLNYILLTVSNAVARSQEVGVRKVMGANRKLIILQFWVETQIVVVLAVILGLVLASLFLPLFNLALGTEIHLSNYSWKEIIPAIILLCFSLGIFAGYYPALLLSRMKPASIIKSFQTFKINPGFSRVLVVFQYTACIILMIAAVIINRQLSYINTRDLGFDKDQILMVSNPTWDPEFTRKVRNRLLAFSESQPSIIQFSGMNGGLDGSYNTNGFDLNGEHTSMSQLTVDFNYFEMLGLKFIMGRPFSKTVASDSSRKIRAAVVNETLFRMLGKTARLGEYNEPIDAKIIGVVKDYHFESLSKKIEPQEHVLANNFEMYFMFKIKAGQMQPTIAKIEKEWKLITNNYPFEYKFLDQSITKMYESDMRWQKTIQASCFFALLIACMGLFGLSAINASNRTKEIGIRKVLGASIKDIVSSLSLRFLLMVILAIVIASPAAWWIMNKWLEDFAYRIDISWWMFAIVGFIALIIALCTVSFQAIKAALANPVESLRTE